MKIIEEQNAKYHLQIYLKGLARIIDFDLILRINICYLKKEMNACNCISIKEVQQQEQERNSVQFTFKVNLHVPSPGGGGG